MSGRRESIAAAMVSGLARSMSARVSGTTSPARRGPRSRPSCPWAPRTAIFMGIVGSTGKNACATRNEPFLVAQAFLPVPPGMSPSWWHRHSCLCEYLSRETPLWLLRRRRRGGGRRWRRRRRGRLEERIVPGLQRRLLRLLQFHLGVGAADGHGEVAAELEVNLGVLDAARRRVVQHEALLH